MTEQSPPKRKRRRFKMRQVAENSRTRGATVAENPPVNRSEREPVFAELDRQIAEEAEQARRKVARAEAKA